MSAHPHTILLIDDNPEEHGLFEIALKKILSNAQLHSFLTCEEVLEAVSHGSLASPEFVFLDIAMPLVDGNGCLCMLRQSKYFRDSSIVIYSTRDHNEQIRFMLKHGAQFYLDKSLDFDTFCVTLRKILVKEIP
jgi:DNA-binding NarL/FixJ family response regulator